MTAIRFLALVSLSLAGSALGDSHGVHFDYPVAGLNLHYLDTLNASWTSEFPSPALYTFCEASNSTTRFTSKLQLSSQQTCITNHPLELVQDNLTQNGFSLILISWPDVIECWVDLRSGTNATPGHGANSPHFDVKTEARKRPIVATANLHNLSEPPERLSGSAKAGIGIGVTLGVLLIAALLTGLFLVHKRRLARTSNLTELDTDTRKSSYGAGHSDPGAGHNRQLLPLHQTPVEMETQRKKWKQTPTELPTQPEVFEMGTGHERAAGEVSDERVHEPKRFSWVKTPV